MSFHHIFEKHLISNEGGGYCAADGKMGFYYKECEILPPLPGEARSLQIFSSPSHSASRDLESFFFNVLILVLHIVQLATIVMSLDAVMEMFSKFWVLRKFHDLTMLQRSANTRSQPLLIPPFYWTPVASLL